MRISHIPMMTRGTRNPIMHILPWSDAQTNWCSSDSLRAQVERNGGILAQSFENVRLIIADPSPMVRTGLRGALFAIGFRNVNETASFIKLHDLIEQDAIDLLITSSELEGNDTGFLISEMRNQRLGPNPFPVVITLLANAEPDYVKKVIDSGADDLVLTPVQPDQLILRIEKLTRTRKPFVVTHDYTGPDRRTKARAFET